MNVNQDFGIMYDNKHYDFFEQLDQGFTVNEIQTNGLEMFTPVAGYKDQPFEDVSPLSPLTNSQSNEKVYITVQQANIKMPKRARALSLPEALEIVDHSNAVDQTVELLSNIDFNDITVSELKHYLKMYGLSTTGKKVDLVNRICEYRNLLLQRSQGQF